MSDFGNETSSSAIRVVEKSAEGMMRFLKFLLERQEEKRVNAQLQVEKLKEKGERTAKLKIEGKVGYVKAKLLQKTGEPLVGINLTLNEQQMRDFARLAKKYGLLYTSISDIRKTGEKVHSIYIREKDLAIAEVITDRMTEDLQLNAVDDKINIASEQIILSQLIRRNMESDETERQDLIRKLLESDAARGKLYEQLMQSPKCVRLGKAYNNKGITLLNLERYEEALVCFDNAIETDPFRMSYYNNKGIALDELGSYEEALVCFDKVISDDYSCCENTQMFSCDTVTERDNWRIEEFTYDYINKREIAIFDDLIPNSDKPITDTIRDLVKDALSSYTRPQTMTKNLYWKAYKLKMDMRMALMNGET